MKVSESKEKKSSFVGGNRDSGVSTLNTVFVLKIMVETPCGCYRQMLTSKTEPQRGFWKKNVSSEPWQLSHAVSVKREM